MPHRSTAARCRAPQRRRRPLIVRLWDLTFLTLHHDFWTAAYRAIDD
jgi:hypothetical protein